MRLVAQLASDPAGVGFHLSVVLPLVLLVGGLGVVALLVVLVEVLPLVLDVLFIGAVRDVVVDALAFLKIFLDELAFQLLLLFLASLVLAYLFQHVGLKVVFLNDDVATAVVVSRVAFQVLCAVVAMLAYASFQRQGGAPDVGLTGRHADYLVVSVKLGHIYNYIR